MPSFGGVPKQLPEVGSSSMALESSAFFRERAAQVGVPQPAVDAIEAEGWTSMGAFAFATSQPPGMADDTAFRRDIAVPILGANPQLGPLAAVRRLFFEAYTMVAADMRDRVERTDEDPPKKLPKVEREDRMTRVRTAFQAPGCSKRKSQARQ